MIRTLLKYLLTLAPWRVALPIFFVLIHSHIETQVSNSLLRAFTFLMMMVFFDHAGLIVIQIEMFDSTFHYCTTTGLDAYSLLSTTKQTLQWCLVACVIMQSRCNCNYFYCKWRFLKL